MERFILRNNVINIYENYFDDIVPTVLPYKIRYVPIFTVIQKIKVILTKLKKKSRLSKNKELRCIIIFKLRFSNWNIAPDENERGLVRFEMHTRSPVFLAWLACIKLQIPLSPISQEYSKSRFNRAQRELPRTC